MLKAEVYLPGPLAISNTENKVGGFRARDKFLKEVEDILHVYMEAAVADIGQLDRHYGGVLAKDWPIPPATLTDAYQVGHEIGRRSAFGVAPFTSSKEPSE